MNAIAKTEGSAASAVVTVDATSLMEVISRAARDPQTDVDKLERLMAMYERINERQGQQVFRDAMNAAQQEMRPISQDAANPQTRSKYASFAALDNRMRPIYTKHGFSISFDTADGAPQDHIRVVCKVAHKTGYCEAPHLDMPADGKGAKGGDVMTKTHATMAAVSYAKRGLLKMIFNIAEGESDDDGNGAGGGTITQEQVNELADLIKAADVNLQKFLEYVGADHLSAIPANRFAQAKRALEKKVKK